jgi:type IV pilus assembly protein PilO
MADNPIAKLPLVGQLVLSLFLGIAVCGVFYWLKFGDMLDEETTKQATLKTLGEEIRALEVTKNKLSEFRAEVEQRKNRLEVLKRILPADKETPELMKKVQYLATQSNLTIKKFNPMPTVTKQFEVPPTPGAKPATPPPAAGARPATAQAEDTYQEWPITVELEGTYHSLGLFLDRVSRLSRLVNVGSIKVTAETAPKSGKTIKVACVATTYVYVEAPRAPVAAPGAQP